MSEEYRLAIDALKAQKAPAGVEQKVLVTFRRQRTVRRLRIWSVAAVAAALLVVIGARREDRAYLAPPPPMLASMAAPMLAPPLVAVTKMPVARVGHRSRKRAEEIATPYYPLPGAEWLPSPGAEAVVRVVVPRSALQMVGFPLTETVGPEFVRADMVFGQDGVARAIRFVR